MPNIVTICLSIREMHKYWGGPEETLGDERGIFQSLTYTLLGQILFLCIDREKERERNDENRQTTGKLDIYIYTVYQILYIKVTRHVCMF